MLSLDKGAVKCSNITFLMYLQREEDLPHLLEILYVRLSYRSQITSTHVLHVSTVFTVLLLYRHISDLICIFVISWLSTFKGLNGFA